MGFNSGFKGLILHYDRAASSYTVFNTVLNTAMDSIPKVT